MGLLKGDTPFNSFNTNSNSTHAIPSGSYNAVLDKGSQFEGKLTFEGSVRIDGKFKGEINSEARLIVGEGGKIEATINVDSISISGEVIGDITAKSKVEIHAPAVVKGNIRTASLVIEEGAQFDGACTMEKNRKSSGDLS